MPNAKSKAIERKKESHADKMSRKYGGTLSTGEYIKPDTKKFAREQKMFDSAKREINRLKRQGK